MLKIFGNRAINTSLIRTLDIREVRRTVALESDFQKMIEKKFSLVAWFGNEDGITVAEYASKEEARKRFEEIVKEINEGYFERF